MDQLLALRVFVRIAEAGNFSKAADSLNIPRPSATKLIQELETHLRVKLLQRTTRRVTVTPDGAAYYERASRLIADLGEMDAQASHARSQFKGRLRVDIGSSLANLILIPRLPAFRRLYPDIQLDLGVSDRLADLIGEGVDCVIRGGALSETSLVARRIAELAYVTCASPAYLAGQGTPDHPRDLERGHYALGCFSSLTGRPFPLQFHFGGEVIEPAVPVAVGVNESTAHLTGLVAGLGLGQTFEFMAQPDIARGTLTRLLENWSRPRHPLHILYPPNRHLSAKLRVFIDWVAEVFAAFDARRA